MRRMRPFLVLHLDFSRLEKRPVPLILSVQECPEFRVEITVLQTDFHSHIPKSRESCPKIESRRNNMEDKKTLVLRSSDTL